MAHVHWLAELVVAKWLTFCCQLAALLSNLSHAHQCLAHWGCH